MLYIQSAHEKINQSCWNVLCLVVCQHYFNICYRYNDNGESKPDGEFALISLDCRDTCSSYDGNHLAETIWQTTCSGQLSVDERRDWGMLLDSGKVTVTEKKFNFEKVRRRPSWANSILPRQDVSDDRRFGFRYPV